VSADDLAPTPSDPRTADRYSAAIAAFGDVSEALSELHELDDLLHLIARRICELVGVRRCSLYLRDERSNLYRGQVGHWLHDIDEGVKRLTSGGAGDAFTREIVATKAPVVVQDTRSDTRPIKSTMRSWDVRSMLGVPMVLRGEVVGIVYLDDADQRRQYTTADESIASIFANLAAIAIQQARLTSDLRAKLTTVATQNVSMRRAAVVDDRLTALVVEGSTLSEIATAIAELTGKSCAIHDAELRQIASGRPAGDDDGMLPKLLGPEARSHPDVRRAIAGLRDNRPAVVGPMPYAGVHNRCIVAPVAAGADRWGHLLLLEHGSRLTNFDMLVARRGATVIAWGMSAERRAAAAEWNVGASLAGELIRGNRDLSALERRAEHQGFRIDEPHALCLITAASESGTIVPDARAVADAFVPDGRAERRPLATAVTEGVGVIVPLPSDDAQGLRAVKDRVGAACDALDAEGALLAGISTVCHRPTDYVRAYEQATQVVRCLNTFGAADRTQVLAANDLGAGRLFLATSNAAEADRFVEETLGRLLADRSRADLLTSLHVFCRHGRSVRRTSQVMGVHENTIRYRIMRAESLIELDVTNDADAQFSVQLALLILRLKGVLPWEAAGPPAGEGAD
jgi:hypothetical protein